MSERKYYISLHLPIWAKTEIFSLIDERDSVIVRRQSEVLDGCDTSFQIPHFTLSAIAQQEYSYYDKTIDDILLACGRA